MLWCYLNKKLGMNTWLKRFMFLDQRKVETGNQVLVNNFNITSVNWLFVSFETSSFSFIWPTFSMNIMMIVNIPLKYFLIDQKVKCWFNLFQRKTQVLMQFSLLLIFRWKNYTIRFIFTWLMIGGFCVFIYGGPLFLMFLVRIVGLAIKSNN